MTAARRRRGRPGLDVTAVLQRRVELFIERGFDGTSAVERDALTRRRRLDRFAAGLVKDAVAAGDLRPDVEPALTARLLFGMVNSLVEWLRPASTHTADELADAVTAAAFDGLRIT